MEFLKKHYEKVVLSAVLVGLTAALVFIPLRLTSTSTNLEAMEQEVKTKPKKPFKPLDLASHTNVLHRLKEQKRYTFTKPHNLINPVLWQKQTNQDGSSILIKAEQGTEIGPGALKISSITPLYFRVGFERLQPNNVIMHLIRQDKPPGAPERDRVNRSFLKVGDSAKAPDWAGHPAGYWEASEPLTITLKEIKPSPEKPEAWVFDRSDKPGEVFTVTSSTPFQEIQSYEANLSYPPEGQVFNNVRAGMSLIFAGDTNKVVDIQASQVVISTLNGKITTITNK